MMGKGKLYRSGSGKIMGVCKGLANWLKMDVSLVRLGFIIVAFMTGGTFCIAYIVMGIFLPVDDSDESTYHRTRCNRSYKKQGFTVDDVKDEFSNLRSRMKNMEDTMFDKESDWDKRYKNS
ncbi:MAG: PspC domain-containing protein [Spirochaetaceae bacterium]